MSSGTIFVMTTDCPNLIWLECITGGRDYMRKAKSLEDAEGTSDLHLQLATAYDFSDCERSFIETYNKLRKHLLPESSHLFAVPANQAVHMLSEHGGKRVVPFEDTAGSSIVP